MSNAAIKHKSRCNPSVDTKPSLFTFSHKDAHLRNTPIARGVKKYAFKSIKEPPAPGKKNFVHFLIRQRYDYRSAIV